jgi:hypothetical protein
VVVEREDLRRCFQTVIDEIAEVLGEHMLSIFARRIG